jgi:predicted ATP-grasp superfamily ATP-dependent carboligase
MARGKKPKLPFDDLPEDWRIEIEQSKTEDINTKIVELTMAETENLQAKALDGDLKEKKEAVKFASEGYREATKSYKLRMKYILSVLEGRGKA